MLSTPPSLYALYPLMMSMKIITIVGARPQFIKAATVSRWLRRPEFNDIQEKIIHTGQHYDFNLSAAFFKELDIPEPTYNLGVGSGRHGQQTGMIMARLEKVLEKERPNWILLYGDTNSTLAGALVAAKAAIPIAHVEAGLRSFRRGMPEEVNRIVTDRLSDLLFAPTLTAVNHLRREGRVEGVHRVGDVMYDNFLYFRDRINSSEDIKSYSLEAGHYILVTVHREENTNVAGMLKTIMEGLDKISRRIPVVFPMHPRTLKALKKRGLNIPKKIQIIEPVTYTQMLRLIIGAAAVATDSGGLQKEAFFASVPCVTLREETEWVETLEKGWNRLVPPANVDAAGIEEALLTALNFSKNTVKYDHYGRGDAAPRILEVFKNIR